MDSYKILLDEYTNDPLSRGYLSMNTNDLLIDFNLKYRNKKQPKEIFLSEMIGLISDISFTKVFDHPRFTEFKKDVDDKNINSCNIWLYAFNKRGLITSEELNILIEYINRTDDVPITRPQELGIKEEINNGFLYSSNILELQVK